MRTVHRLQQKFFVFFGRVDGLKRILAVFGVVSRCYVQLFSADMRGNNLIVLKLLLYFFQKLFEFQTKLSSFGKPQRKPGANNWRKSEKFEFFTDFSVVALFGFFNHHQIFVQHFLFRKCNSVKTSQLRAFFVAAPIRSGCAQYFYRFYIRSIGQMRAAAQIGEISLRVGGYGSVFEFVDEFYFVVFIAFREHVNGIGFRDAFSLNVFFGGDEFHHFLFDGWKIGFLDGDTLSGVNIVVKSILYCRPNTEFYARVKFLQRFGHQVRRRVPVCVLAFGIVPFQ